MSFSKHFRIVHNKQFLKAVAGVLMVVTMLPGEANAYTDPGTGTFLLQMLLAAITGSLFFVCTLRHRIRMLFKRNRNSSDIEGESRVNSRLDG